MGRRRGLGLAKVLLGAPNLLLLDEPTNHLDLPMLEWLEEWLSGFKGAVLLVSHDRVFLDHAVNRVVYLDPQTHTMREVMRAITRRIWSRVWRSTSGSGMSTNNRKRKSGG